VLEFSVIDAICGEKIQLLAARSRTSASRRASLSPSFLAARYGTDSETTYVLTGVGEQRLRPMSRHRVASGVGSDLMIDKPQGDALTGPSFDLYSAANMRLAERGALGEPLTKSEIRALCTCVIRHGARLKHIELESTRFVH
jgi:hypothetical protein